MRKIAVVALLAGSACVWGQSFPTNEQMRQYRALAEPRLSPDGKLVLFRVTDSTKDGAKSHLWLTAVDGSAARQMTFSPESDKRGERGGEWMPDGQSLVFLAKRGEHLQLFRLPMNGGEAKAFELKVSPPVDESKREGALPPAKADAKKEEAKPEPVEIDVMSYRISPDGKTIAVIALDPQTAGEKKAKDAKADAQWVDHSMHGSRLYLMDVATEKMTAAAVPVDVQGASWSADGARLVVVTQEPNGADEIAPANSAWVVEARNAANVRKLAEIPATVGPIAWSRDGSRLVYIAQAKMDAPPGVFDVYEDTVATSAVRNLSDGRMESLGGTEPVVLRDGGFVLPALVGLDGGMIRYADGAAAMVKLPVSAVTALSTNAAQSGWAFLGGSAGKATALYFAPTLGGEAKQLGAPAVMPEGVRSQVAKRISWKSDQFTIEGMLFLPPEAGQHKVPLIVEVHGGPTGAYADRFDPFADFLLGHGWAVLRTNPRGSIGHGAAFAAANKNDLGGGDYRDIVAGVDFVLKTEPVDADRMALTGYSYGGEMAGFVEGKTTRFKAIVSMAPVIDQFSEYGMEHGSIYDQWFYGKPWEHFADAWRQSPLAGVAKAKTPFLLLQGEEDATDPMGQSQEMYRALRQMGVKVEMVTYPREDHGPLGGAIDGQPTGEPWHGFDARQRIVEFVTKAFGDAK